MSLGIPIKFVSQSSVISYVGQASLIVLLLASLGRIFLFLMERYVSDIFAFRLKIRMQNFFLARPRLEKEYSPRYKTLIIQKSMKFRDRNFRGPLLVVYNTLLTALLLFVVTGSWVLLLIFLIFVLLFLLVIALDAISEIQIQLYREVNEHLNELSRIERISYYQNTNSPKVSFVKSLMFLFQNRSHFLVNILRGLTIIIVRSPLLLIPLFLATALFFGAALAEGRKSDSASVFHLKSGSEICGIVLVRDDNRVIALEHGVGLIVIFEDEISRI